MRIVHGLAATYATYSCRCELCREANRVYHLTMRTARRAERVEVDGVLVHPAARHGMVGSYRYYGCRCRPCTSAHNVDHQRRKMRALERERGAA